MLLINVYYYYMILQNLHGSFTKLDAMMESKGYITESEIRKGLPELPRYVVSTFLFCAVRTGGYSRFYKSGTQHFLYRFQAPSSAGQLERCYCHPDRLPEFTGPGRSGP
jgi:hypothetical protein